MRRSTLAILLPIMCVASLRGQESLSHEPPDTLYMLNRLFQERCAAWEADTTRTAAIVMLGNSITAGGKWDSLLRRDDVANRGIGSDNTYGFLARMRYVTHLRPRVCFVMGGINDIYAGFTVETVVRNYAAILDTLRAHNIIPVVQSTLFASHRWRLAREKNELVAALNGQLRQLCAVRGVPFLDINSRLSTDGLLDEQYTTDGIHLTGSAYTVWVESVQSFLRIHRL